MITKHRSYYFHIFKTFIKWHLNSKYTIYKLIHPNKKQIIKCINYVILNYIHDKINNKVIIINCPSAISIRL